MILNNYKITEEPEEGIWVSKKELELLYQHYGRVADKHKRAWTNDSDGGFKFPFYLGKCELIIDILKHFDQLEGE